LIAGCFVVPGVFIHYIGMSRIGYLWFLHASCGRGLDDKQDRASLDIRSYAAVAGFLLVTMLTATYQFLP
jgi:hypothetical protein